MIQLSGKSVGVIGLARSGIAAANNAKAKGANVIISEMRTREQCGAATDQLKKGIVVEFGGHSDQLLSCDIIIKSPGVPNELPILKKARKKNISIWSEIEFAARMISPKRIVAITGTNGKTTTTTLIGAIFAAAKGKTVVAGNIGDPLASMTGKVAPETTVVLEVSSYQLEDSPSFHPTVSSVLNVTPDHIEHHHTMANYIKAKKKIFANQKKKDYCVLNYDDPICRKMAKNNPATVVFFSRKKILTQGVFYTGNTFVLRIGKMKAEIPAALRIPGMHNIENVLAAIAITSVAGIPVEVIKKTIARFPGVEHRIELVREIAGVRYYNDSKATNVDSTRVALEAFTQPIWVILGGRDKGAPYTPLKELVKEKVRGILLIGEAAPKIKRDLKGTVPLYDCVSMANALKQARCAAKQGEVVLLSPACASFDQFKDYEDRGRQFKTLVHALPGK
jgi:UDP-N-acetylmuramoylalanine--D-glutamate ligase